MEWQPIETAPMDGTPVLLWEQWAATPVVGYFRNYWYVVTEHIYADYDGITRDNLTQDQITHWMPLPAPPAARQPGEGDSRG